MVGRTIAGRFKISNLIARGGMGKVYRAEQAPLGRVCALKILDPTGASENENEFQKRFTLEANIASKLTHPNTVTIFDYGIDGATYYLAMEYLEGVTLHKALRDAGTFSEERAAHIARQVCRAVREAHGLGVIHRDLKPANIFLMRHGDEADFVKVLDFGLVKIVGAQAGGEELTATGVFMGSPKYMAPEQVRGDAVDARTDIYAIGVILYEMLSGRVPFDRQNSVQVLMAHVNEAPVPIRQANPRAMVSKEMEAVVLRCLAKKPEDRFPSTDELLVALKRFGDAAATGSREVSSPPLSRPQLPVPNSRAPAPSVSRPAPRASAGPPPRPDFAAVPSAIPRVSQEPTFDEVTIVMDPDSIDDFGQDAVTIARPPLTDAAPTSPPRGGAMLDRRPSPSLSNSPGSNGVNRSNRPVPSPVSLEPPRRRSQPSAATVLRERPMILAAIVALLLAAAGIAAVLAFAAGRAADGPAPAPSLVPRSAR
jgi:serine/threonine protein kinase